MYVIEDKKNPKDLKTGKHALLNTDSEKNFIDHHSVSEKLEEKSQKILSFSEKVEEKVIEKVVKENNEIKETNSEKIVLDRKSNYEIRKSIQDMKNQPFKEKILPSTKETMKIQMENESFFKSLKVKAIKMEISDFKDHRMEIEKNISLKQSVDEIRKDGKVEKTKFIIGKQIARKKYMVEKEISFVDLKIQNNSKSRKSFEIKMNTNEDKRITLENIVEKIRDMTQRRIEKAFVQLEPPKLGRVEIEILKEGESLRIMLRVSTDEAKEILEKGSKYLITRLENMGFKIENIQVKENFEGSYNEDKEHQNGESDFREDREDENKRRKFKEVFKRKVSEE
ncbi:MAG TPA: flagellar hook-length control protein FliK [Thermotoga sp.]|nr:flagellar hook-length control protein FliK [Thermotoga sp.]